MKNAKLFSHFAIIYNPNSTGDAPATAKKLQRALRRVVEKDKVLLMPTEYAGHAREIAREIANKHPRPLLISVSGDGGYNEVINGVLSARQSGKSKNPVVTVIGAGNANDHYRVVHKKRSLQEMLDREPRTIDLLKATKRSDSEITDVFYAHSYIGVGITPLIAEELNRNKLNPIKEIRILVKALTTIRPTKLHYDGKDRSIDSLVFANIAQMAKVLTLTDNNSLHDGRFEVIEVPHTNIFGLLASLLRAATVGLKKQPKHEEFTFSLREDHSLQIDGELFECRKGDTIKVAVARDAITTL